MQSRMSAAVASTLTKNVSESWRTKMPNSQQWKAKCALHDIWTGGAGAITTVLARPSLAGPGVAGSHRSFRTSPPAKFGRPATNRRAPGENSTQQLGEYL